MLVKVAINGEKHEAEVEPRLLLVHLIRETLGLTGTHIGCDTSHCGACTVLLDGRPVKSCTVFAVQAHGRQITTVEGLADGPRLHPLQAAFADLGAAQCGYCTPGFLLTAKALLDKNPDPDREEIKEALAGNLCRCTGYIKIYQAVEQAVQEIARDAKTPAAETSHV